MGRDSLPYRMCNFSDVVQLHLSVHDFAEQTGPVSGTDGHEVCALLAIVKVWETGRPAPAHGRGAACVVPAVGGCISQPRHAPMHRRLPPQGRRMRRPCRRCCPCIHGCPVSGDTAGSDPAMSTVEPRGPGARGRGRRMRRPYRRCCPCIHGCPVSGDTAGADPAMFAVEPRGPGARGRGDACVAPTVGVVPAFTVAPCFATPPGRTLRCSPLNRVVRAHGAGATHASAIPSVLSLHSRLPRVWRHRRDGPRDVHR